MTINLSDNSPRISYTVSQGATQTTFAVPFEFFDDADLNVYVDGTLKTITTHYTVSGGSGSTGSVGISVTGISGGSTVIITRNIALARTTDFPTSGPFDVATLNTELDRFTAQLADQKDQNDRSISLADDDAAASMTLPLKASRVGTVLGFNATTGAAEAGPTIANVNSLSAITANINTVAGIQANVTTVAGISANTTTVAGIASNVTSVAGNASNINSAVSNASNINTVAGSISNVNAVGAKASLITSDFVSDLNALAVTDVINDINTLATSDIVSDLNTLATSDIVSDLNTLATSDIVSDINTLATSDIVTDLNLLATSDFVSDLNTVATSGNVTAVNNVSGAIANVNTVANNLTTVNTFGTQYQVSANAPSNPTEGLLWFDTTNDIMKVYDGSGFVNAGSSVNGTANRFAWTVGTSSGSYNGSLTVFPAVYDAGFVDVYLNGVKLLVGTDVTATNGSSVTLASDAVAADIVEIVSYGTFTAATELSLADNKKIQLGSSQDLQLFHDGTDSHINVTGALTVDVSGDIALDAGGGEIYFQDDGTTIGYLSNSSTDLLLGVQTQDKDIYIQGNDGGSTINALHFDMSAAGYSTFNNGGRFAATLQAPYIFGRNDSDTGISFGENGANIMQLYTANAERIHIDANGLVGIGGTPSYPLHIQSGSTSSVLRITNTGSTDANVNSILQLATATNVAQLLLNEQNNYSQFNHSGDLTAHYDDVDNHIFRTKAGVEKARIRERGDVNSNHKNPDGSFTGVFSNQTGVALADDASFSIASSGTAGGGILAVYEHGSGQSAVFHLGYNRSTLISGDTNVFATSDTDGKSCVFASNHTLTVKNRRGATVTYSTCLHTAGLG